MKKNRKIVLLTMVMSCTVAIAAECVIGSVVLPTPINVGFSSMSSPEAWNKIASALKGYGDAYKNLEGSVKINVKLAIAPMPVLIDMPKACNETLEKSAKNVSENASDMYGGGRGGDGDGGIGEVCGVDAGVVGYTPVYATTETCTPAGCSTEQILIGYEPIYGTTTIGAC